MGRGVSGGPYVAWYSFNTRSISPVSGVDIRAGAVEVRETALSHGAVRCNGVANGGCGGGDGGGLERVLESEQEYVQAS